MENLPEKVKIETDSPSAAIQEALRRIIPGALSGDGTIDAQVLTELSGLPVSGIKNGPERFGLMWAGRSKAISALKSPSRASLIPQNSEAESWNDADHVFIEGDNLESLKLMQKAYNDKIKLIYIDPPYNTGSDFVYNDDFTDSVKHYLEVTGQSDSDGNRLVANTEVLGRKHSNWLTMMYPRLVLARNLLSDQGLIFVSIDDNECANLMLIMDEIFGVENRRGVFIWKKKGTSTNVAGVQVSALTEYIICYGRTQEAKIAPRVTSTDSRSYPHSDQFGNYRLTVIEKKASGVYDRETMKFPILGVTPRAGKRWQIGKEKATELESLGRFILDEKNIVKLKIYESEEGDTTSAQPNLLLEHGSTQSGQTEVDNLVGPGVFDNPKPVALMRHIIKMANVESGDLVLDFFAGSGSMGDAVLRENHEDGSSRKFVLVTLGEETAPNSAAFRHNFKKISDIAIARLEKVISQIDASGTLDFRRYKLGPSAFVNVQEDASIDNLLFFETTLKPDASNAALASEVLLKHGVQLNEAWQLQTIGAAEVLVAAGVGIVLNRLYNQQVLEDLLKAQLSTIIFLEDSFNGNDSLKSNAHFALKQANITMKTV